MLDENVPVSVRTMLEAEGHSVQLIKDYIPPGSQDELVATVSEKVDSILVSFDGDFEKIAPRIPKGSRRRFKKLSRIWMQCPEPSAARRLKAALSLIEAEYALAQNSNDQRMTIWVAAGFIKTIR